MLERRLELLVGTLELINLGVVLFLVGRASDRCVRQSIEGVVFVVAKERGQRGEGRMRCSCARRYNLAELCCEAVELSRRIYSELKVLLYVS